MKIDKFFQKAYYINLDRRSDRKSHFEKEISKVGLENFFERFSAHDGINEPDHMKRHYYCGSSYMQLFKKIIDEGHDRVLIFEDDIMFYNDGPRTAIEIIESALEDIQKFPDWDMLYFGGHPIGIMHKVSDNLSVPEKILAMHATGYTRKGIEKILPYKPFADSAIDGWVSARPHIRKYITNELAVAQMDGDSDLNAFGKSDGPSGYLTSYKKVKFKPSKNMKQLGPMIEPNYIAPRLQGRTGNLMFQIAHAYTKALEYDRQFIVPSQESSTGHLEKGLFRKFDFRIQKIPEPSRSKHIWGPFTHGPIEPPSTDQPTIYAGWYQSEKFFGKYKEVIKDAFSAPPEFIAKAFADYPFLATHRVAAINVRRGDYLTQPRRHPVVTHGYIDKAINKLPYHDIKLVVSDDIEWCKKNLPYEGMVFAENYYDQDAMWLLSLCDHYVISNSTFSWWGAWLSRNKDKVVISPSTWFGPDVAEDPRDIWCDDWIKIPTKWDNGYIVCT
jgi:hypothetical protein